MNEATQAAEGIGVGSWVGLGLIIGVIVWRIIESRKSTGTLTGGFFGGGGGDKPPKHNK